MSEFPITVLSEYQIKTENKKDFNTFIPTLKEELKKMGVSNISFFEGVDQPGLIVEEFIVPNIESYHHIKKTRYEEQSIVWKKFHNYIMGGRDKVHIWSFSKIDV